MKGGEGKFLFKKAMDRSCPTTCCTARRWAFAVPLARWFPGPLKQRVRDAVLGETLAATRWFERSYPSIWSTPTSPARATTALAAPGRC